MFLLVIVTLEPCERSETYVNGKRVAQPVQLRSGETGRGLKSSKHMACASNSLILYLKVEVIVSIRIYVPVKLQKLSFCIRES